MILAIAILGLSASILAEKFCHEDNVHCESTLYYLRLYGLEAGPLRYSIFLGIYGILVAIIGTASLFVDMIPPIVPLVGDSIGAVFFLAGGIAWVVNLSKLKASCSDFKGYSDFWWPNPWWAGRAESSCRRCEADHGLIWAIFAFTAALALCDFLRRRDRVQSSK